jgi:L-iditol 2-dehydrogenase
MAMPMIMGHEASGTIAQVGEGVTNVQVGDRVAMEPVSMDLLAEYALQPSAKAYKMPDAVSFEEGALCEPFAVAVHAVKLAGVTKGNNVLIIGAGPIGLLSLVAAKAYDPARVVVADVKQGRLETCKEYGADALVNTEGMDSEKAAAACVAMFDGKPIDIVIDAAGHPSTVETACIAVKPLGVVQMVGIATMKGEFNYLRFLMKESVFCVLLGLLRFQTNIHHVLLESISAEPLPTEKTTPRPSL